MKYALLSIICIYAIFGCNEENGANNRSLSIEIFRIVNATDSTYQLQDDVIGQANFIQKTNKTQLTIQLWGLEPGSSHAVHLHVGSCEVPGKHWNQSSAESFCNYMNLGEIWAKPKAGDVGNVRVDENGFGELKISTDLWSLETGNVQDITSTVMIIHESDEDFPQECFQQHSHIHDNPKIGCGDLRLPVKIN